MTIKYNLYLLLLFFFAVNFFSAQSNDKLDQLNQNLNLIDSAFQKGEIESFNRFFTLEKTQNFYKTLIEKKFIRKAGAHKIVKFDNESAFVFLSGTALYGNSGDETNFSTKYSGIYKFKKNKDSWKVVDQIPIDRLNKIHKQSIKIDVQPGRGIKVSDTLTIDVKDQIGFLAKFNHKALLSDVLLNGQKVEYLFDGGLLWVDIKQNQGQQLIINYTLLVEKDEKDRNSGYFGDTFGHLRNQYYWHPFFSYSSANDRADFTVHCSIPKEYGLSTSLPQEEKIIGDFNIIQAKSSGPTFALCIYYDLDWAVKKFKKDKIDVVIYATKEFEPSAEKLYDEYSKTYDNLKNYFGKPTGDFFGIVQDRSSGGNGWKNRSNSTIIASEKGSYLITDHPKPRAVFGHEIAHLWTNPHGEATNFLTEGWATYCEAILLKSIYGNTIVQKFFETQKQNYFEGNFNGTSSLAEDYGNNGVSYCKGAWLFYIIEDQIGKQNLRKAMVDFTNSSNQSIKSFIDCVSFRADKNMAPFINSWLKSKQIPELKVEKSARMIKITQTSDVFIFPLKIRLNLRNGKYEEKIINMNRREQNIDISDIGTVDYTVDPENKLLMRLK